MNQSTCHIWWVCFLYWLVWWLTHWGRVTHICVGKLTIIASDNGLWPGRRQAIIWTNTGILLIEPLGTNFIETLIAIHTFPFKKINLKMSSEKWRPSYLGLNVSIAHRTKAYNWVESQLRMCTHESSIYISMTIIKTCTTRWVDGTPTTEVTPVTIW